MRGLHTELEKSSNLMITQNSPIFFPKRSEIRQNDLKLLEKRVLNVLFEYFIKSLLLEVMSK